MTIILILVVAIILLALYYHMTKRSNYGNIHIDLDEGDKVIKNEITQNEGHYYWNIIIQSKNANHLKISSV